MISLDAQVVRDMSNKANNYDDMNKVEPCLDCSPLVWWYLSAYEYASPGERYRMFLQTMERIDTENQALQHKKNAFDIRKRLNPHHDSIQIREETEWFNKHIHTIEKTLTVNFHIAKKAYLMCRDDFIDMAANNTEEMVYIRIMERIVDDDIEKEFLNS